MNPFPLEEKARAYVARALPHAPAREREKLVRDWLTKEVSAQGIVEDFQKRVGSVHDRRVLDVGFGNGITLAAFAQQGAHMCGLEVSEELHAIAHEYLQAKEVVGELQLYNGGSFPFADATFDYMYSVSVLEHVTDPAQVLLEAARVLKPGGLFYLAFPNRLFPRETHTGIWFLSYVPRRLARFLLVLFRRNTIDDWNLHFLSYFWLRRLLRRHAIPFTVRYEVSAASFSKRAVKQLLSAMGIHHSALLPHVMVVLERS